MDQVQAFEREENSYFVISCSCSCRDVEYFIAYTTNLEKAEFFKKQIETLRPGANVTIYPLTPVVGAHAGPGTLGLGYSVK